MNPNLNTSDFFGWYNEEITRYRNIEWKIAGYSIGISYAIVLFAHQTSACSLAPNWIYAFYLGVLGICLFFSEIHVHYRLNKFRARRDMLRLNNPDHYDAKTALWHRAGWIDHLYFIGFLFFPVVTIVGAIVILLNR